MTDMKRKIVSLLVAVCLVCTLLPLSVMAANNTIISFKDVDNSKWYVPYVSYVVGHGLMVGTSKDTFSPDGIVSRAQFVQTLYALAQKPSTNSDNVFTDLKKGAYYVDAVSWASEVGVTSGITQTLFGPNQRVTREQAATFFRAYAAKVKDKEANETADISTFPDSAEASKFARSSLQWAVGIKLITGVKKGKNVLLDPKGTMTRAQLATMLKAFHLYINSNEKDDQSDADEIDKESNKDNNKSNDGLGNVFTVEFNSNGGSSVKSQTVSEGGYVQYPDSPSKEGSVFAGWYIDKQLTIRYNFNDKVKSDLTLYARWEDKETEETITISFESNGGSKVVPLTVVVGKEIVEPTAPTRDGYAFVGWYTDPDLNYEYGFDEMAASDLTLYAKWIVVDREKDTDNDNAPDFIEDLFESDPTENDTDKDGLPDGYELYFSSTEPSLKDTNNNGIKDADEDPDNDGLTNIEEMKNETDPLLEDSDGDGIKDGDEIKTYGTNPLVIDTDGDAADDNWEIENGFDPTKKNDSFKVSLLADDPTSEHPVTAGVIGTFTGKQASSLTITPVKEVNGAAASDIPGSIGDVYEFSAESTINDATLVFRYDTTNAIGDNFQPRIYYYNEEEGILEELENQQVEDGIVTAHVPHFSKYVLLNKVDFDAVWDNDIRNPNATDDTKEGLDIVFVVDSSGSMRWNDSSDVRKKASQSFVDKLGENDRAAVIDFASYANVIQSFTNDHDALYSAISRIGASGGTNLSSGISSAITRFTESAYNNNAYKYIVFLTDGDGSYDSSYTKMAADNGIVIYTIGLGSDVRDSVLRSIAEGTGGKYYYATEADQIVGIYDEISFETVDYVTDSNGDGISDYFSQLIHDGKLRTGLGTLQYKGIDFNSKKDYDDDGLKNGDELIVKYDEKKGRVYTKIVSDPTLQDSDYDGVIDSKDSSRLSGVFYGTMLGYYDVSNANYTMDFRQFFNSPEVFSESLCSASMVLSNGIYSEGGFKYSDGKIGTINNIEDMLKLHGFEEKSIKDYRLAEYYKDDDISEIGVGKKTISYNGKTKTVIAVVIRGTNGTVEEWSSNFDIGNPTAWNSTDHKGFSIATSRIENYIKEYVSSYEKEGNEIVYWVTGHSRGAAIANLLSARLIDNNKKVFGYTFATPATTVNNGKNSNKYNSIFNYMNTSDLVPYLPLSQWGFDRYGITKKVSVEQTSRQNEWCVATGRPQYNALNKSIIKLVLDRINQTCASSWKEAYKYSLVQIINDSQYNSISSRAKRYCNIVERKKIFTNEHNGYKLYPSTIFVFQLLAEAIAGEKVDISLIKELWNTKYGSAVALLVINDIGANKFNQIKIAVHFPNEFGESLIGDGHAPATYYVLTH